MQHPCLASIRRQSDVLQAAIRAEVRSGDEWSVVDFPNHGNIGDAAIWVGQNEAIKKATGREASYKSSVEDDPAQSDHWKSAPGQLFLHGGGNFGDLYPKHQDYRLAILRASKGRRVVQMAQSIHFSTPAFVEETARVIGEHGNFCFFARDRVTFDFASKHFDCEVKLVPDGAFGLGPLERTKPVSMKTLQFRREDIEAVSGPVPGSVDWPIEEPSEAAKHQWPGALHHVLRGNFSKRARRHAGLQAVAEWRLRRGVDLLSSAEEIVCDRLHVHILSTLLGIPHKFSDNTTGKISAYYNTWTHDCSVAKPA